ncbi:MAG: hypothetical protein CMJ58_07310 [Planctomycetaceae bacterium]|nr:hypothetical protein [Planctomycetaceae bacterium]
MNGAVAMALLAQMSKWSRLGDGFRPGARSGDATVFVVMGILAAIGGLIAVIVAQNRKRNDMSVRCDDPEKLFRELCLAHDLPVITQRSLRQLASARKFDHPAEIFLSPAAFDTSDLPASAGLSDLQVQDLRARLF